MFKFVRVLIVLFPVVAFGGTQQVCGLRSAAGMTTIDDSAAQMAQFVSPVIADGLNELAAFPEIQDFVRLHKPAQICVSSVAVGKNIYQYDLFLITVSMTDAQGKSFALPMLFQSASIQAHENVGPKPWLGFSRRDFTAAIRTAAAQASFQPLPSIESPLASLDKIFSGPGVDASYVYVPGVDPHWTTFLVTRLRKYDTGNPFTDQYLNDAAIVQIDENAGVARFAPLDGFFDLYTRFSDAQDQVAHQANDANAMDVLGKLAAP